MREANGSQDATPVWLEIVFLGDTEAWVPG